MVARRTVFPLRVGLLWAGQGDRRLGGVTVPSPTGPLPMICSARGCTTTAGWALRWNNPRLHPPARRKTWLACDQHRARLGDFLNLRGFLREVEPLPQSPTLVT